MCVCVVWGGVGVLEGRGAMEEGGEGKGLVVVVALSTLYLLAPSPTPLCPPPPPNDTWRKMIH